jgi:hypothetical protein
MQELEGLQTPTHPPTHPYLWGSVRIYRVPTRHGFFSQRCRIGPSRNLTAHAKLQHLNHSFQSSPRTIVTETNRTRLVLFGMQNRAFARYLAATHSILFPVLLARPTDTWEANRQTDTWPCVETKASLQPPSALSCAAEAGRRLAIALSVRSVTMCVGATLARRAMDCSAAPDSRAHCSSLQRF